MQGSTFPILASLFAVSFVALMPFAFAEDQWIGGTENFFSTPDSNQTPGFTKAKEGGSGLRKQLLDNQKDRIPDWQQVKMIPSLSREQRKELNQIYQSAKDDIKPMLDEMKSMRLQAGENKQAALKNPATRQRLREMKQQLLSKRQMVWETAKSKLSAKQLEELDLMRKGQLMPAMQTSTAAEIHRMQKTRPSGVPELQTATGDQIHSMQTPGMQTPEMETPGASEMSFDR